MPSGNAHRTQEPLRHPPHDPRPGPRDAEGRLIDGPPNLPMPAPPAPRPRRAPRPKPPAPTPPVPSPETPPTIPTQEN
jgi:hypothetical protein